MGEPDDTIWRIDRFAQSLSVLGLDLAKATAAEQGCEPGSDFAFLDVENHKSYATNYYRQELESHRHTTDSQDLQFGNRIKNFVASKADILFKLKGKEKLRSGIDYNIDGAQEAYSVFATQLLPLESGMQISNVARRAQIFEILKVGDIILGKVVGKRPFGVFVRLLSLVHGRNLDFNNIDIQALCPKSELEKEHKSREHLDPIDDFDVDDIVQGVICSISKDEERIAISFRSAKLPSEYGNIELGVIEDIEEQNLRQKSFDDHDLDYNEYLRSNPGFSNPTNVQTLIDVLGIDNRPPNSLLRSCQRWTFSDKEADSLRKQQSKKWSMDTTAVGVENFKSGGHEKALKYFNHALQIYDENSEALVARGALYANQNKLEYAIKDFKQALKLHPKHHNASKYLKETLFEKAIRLKNVGNIKEAINIFEDVLELDPRNTESQKHLKELKSLLSAKLEEEENEARKAASLLQENRKKFEHVRKLIKSDPDVVKSSRKKKRKKKKIKKMKSRKYQRRSESETTTTASEAGSHDSAGDEWIEKDLKKSSPRKSERIEHDMREGQAMHSNISAKTSELTQSNLFQKVNILAKDGGFQKQSSDTASGMDVLVQNLEDTSDVATTSAAVCQETQGLHVANNKRFTEMDEGRIENKEAVGRSLEGNLEEVKVEEMEGGVESGTREQAREEREDIIRSRERIGSGNNENIENSGANRRESSLQHSSRSRSGSHEKKDVGLPRRSNTRDLRKESGENTSESDVSSGDNLNKGRQRRSRSRRRERQTSSSSSSSREETTKKIYDDIKSRNIIVQRKGSKNIHRDRSTSRDSSGRSRSRSNSLRRDRSRITRGGRGESRGSRGRRSTSSDYSERSRSRSTSSRRDRSRIIRGRRSASRDSNGRNRNRSRSKKLERDVRSTSRGRKGRRSASRDRRRRRSISGGSSGQQGTIRYGGGRRSTSRDSSGQQDSKGGRQSARKDSRKRSTSRNSRRSPSSEGSDCRSKKINKK